MNYHEKIRLLLLCSNIIIIKCFDLCTWLLRQYQLEKLTCFWSQLNCINNYTKLNWQRHNLLIWIMVQKSSRSSSDSSRSRSRRRDRKRSQSRDATQGENKIFVSDLSGEEHIDSLERKIRDLFSAKCTIESIDIKRSFNQQYSFAFLEIKETQRLNEVIREINGKMIDGNKIRVEKQKKGGQNRREAPDSHNRNCYDCGKPGHIARNCPNRQRGNKDRDQQNIKEDKREAPKEKMRSRRKSASRSRDRKTKKRARSSSSQSSSSSSSSESSRSRSSDYERPSRNRHRKSKKRHHAKKSRHFHKKEGKKSRIRTKRTSSESSSQ